MVTFKRTAIVFSVIAASLAAASFVAADTTNTMMPGGAPFQGIMFPTARVNQPSLSIGPSGQFLTRGMTVASVSGDSFQGQIWGITYTVNWSGNLSEFYLRYGKMATSTPSQQLNVGDEVGVSGIVSSSTPLTVAANVVRDYSITIPRPVFPGMGNDNGEGRGGMMGEGEAGGMMGRFVSSTMMGSSSDEVHARINSLMQQLQTLQGAFNSRRGGPGE